MRFLASAFCFVVLGCGSDAMTSTTVSRIAGTWTLQTINGASLPYVLSGSGANKNELLSDVFTFTADAIGSFTKITTYRTTTNGVVATSSGSDAGSYTLSGSVALITYNGSVTSYTGFLSGTTLTVAEVGYVYKR